MQEIVQFCIDNWQWLLTAILSIFVLVIQVLKKRPVARSLTQFIEFVCNEMPKFINDAEKTGFSGSKKFTEVLGKCMSLLHKLCKCSEVDDKYAKGIFTSQIEAILSTPQKKD